jgi:hypothetical protein
VTCCRFLLDEILVERVQPGIPHRLDLSNPGSDLLQRLWMESILPLFPLKLTH